MADGETKHEKILKRTQLWLAVLAGLVTFIIGAYNIKNVVFAKKGPGTVAIAVQAENGQPIPKATIEITKVQGGVVSSSNTGADGKYEPQKLEPGNYSLKATKTNFQPENLFFAIEPGHTTQLDLKLKPTSASIRSAVEEVGANWIKEFGTPRAKPQVEE